jgi:ABC-type dipeptide/oligopeptide/nickel transport system permease subunit
MSSSRKADRSTALLAYLGIFLFIPVWDFYALFRTLRAGWVAREDQKTGSAALYSIRRLIFLVAAYGLALAGVGLLRGRIAQPGPFGMVITGLRHLSRFSTSQVLAPDVPVGELVPSYLSNSVWLFLLISLCTALFSAILAALITGIHRVAKRNKTLHGVLNLLVWAGLGGLATPVGAISLLVIHVAAVRMEIIPADYSAITGAPLATRIGWLLIPACVSALLPTLVCTRAGLLQWKSADPKSRLTRIAAAMGRAFLDQAGWITGSLIAVEVIFHIPGLGWLAWQAITLADALVLVGALNVFLLFILVMRARSAITTGFMGFDALRQFPREKAQNRPIDWGKVAVVGVFRLIVGGAMLAPQAADPHQVDLNAIYAHRSSAHLMGTDHLGRDVVSRVRESLRVSWAVALTAGVAAASFGGLWGAAAAWVRRQRTLLSDLLADLILLPAEAAILLHPVLIVLALGMQRSGGTVIGLGVIIGLALVPRMAWMVDNQPEGIFLTPLSFKRYLQLAACIFVMATFVSLLYSVSIDMLGSGAAEPTASAGNLLSHFGELISSEIIIRDGRFLRLIVYLSLPGAISCWGGYLLQDFLTDPFEGERQNWLPQMLG